MNKLKDVLKGIGLNPYIKIDPHKFVFQFNIKDVEIANLNSFDKFHKRIDKIKAISDYIRNLAYNEEYFQEKIEKEFIFEEEINKKLNTSSLKVGIKFKERLMNKEFIRIYLSKLMKEILFTFYHLKRKEINDKVIHIFYLENDAYYNFLFGDFEKLYLNLKNNFTKEKIELDIGRKNFLDIVELPNTINMEDTYVKAVSLITTSGDFYKL